MRGYDTLAGSFLGLESLDMDYIFIGAIALAVLVLMLIVLLIVQSVKMGRLKKRLDKFLLGREGTSLEQTTRRIFAIFISVWSPHTRRWDW